MADFLSVEVRVPGEGSHISSRYVLALGRVSGQRDCGGQQTSHMQYILAEQVFPSPGATSFVSPLQLASLKGHDAIVSALIAAGADVRMADRDGDTALHWAAQNGSVQVSVGIGLHVAHVLV